MDENCPSHCANTVIEWQDNMAVLGCLDCGSARTLN